MCARQNWQNCENWQIFFFFIVMQLNLTDWNSILFVSYHVLCKMKNVQEHCFAVLLFLWVLLFLSSVYGWCCCFPSLFSRAALLSLLLGGAAFPLFPCGWWCFSHLLLFSDAPFRPFLLACCGSLVPVGWFCTPLSPLCIFETYIVTLYVYPF